MPAWVPSANRLGWSLPDAEDYAGFLQASGKPAVQLWRVKYLPSKEIGNFMDGPHRRTTGNELFIAQLATPDDATTALAGLKAGLENQEAPEYNLVFESATIGGKQAWRGHSKSTERENLQGYQMMAVGPYVLMESLPEPMGESVLSAAAQGIGR